jgi:hypothetical protein
MARTHDDAVILWWLLAGLAAGSSLVGHTIHSGVNVVACASIMSDILLKMSDGGKGVGFA